MAAEAVLWAADHHRREVFAAWPTVLAIQLQKFVGSMMDRYLAKKAWEGLLTDEPLPTERRGNLFGVALGIVRRARTLRRPVARPQPPPLAQSPSGRRLGLRGGRRRRGSHPAPPLRVL